MLVLAGALHVRGLKGDVFIPLLQAGHYLYTVLEQPEELSFYARLYLVAEDWHREERFWPCFLFSTYIFPC